MASVVGLSGTGKSTAIESVLETLQAKGLSAKGFHDRLGSKKGRQLDKALQANKNTWSSEEILMGFIRNRRQVVDDAILPSLKKNDITITDRYYPDTIAFQGAGENLGVERVAKLAIQSVQDALPNRIFLLDTTVETSLSRMQSRGEASQIYDNESVMFFQRVRECYLHQALSDQKFSIINAELSKEQVASTIVATILSDIEALS